MADKNRDMSHFGGWALLPVPFVTTGKSARPTCSHPRSLALACALALIPTLTFAQIAPQIDYLFPAGGQRGTTVDVEMAGKYMPGPCGVWVDGSGIVSKTKTTEGRLQLAIAADAALGNHFVRIFSVQGGSTPRPFVVGELPEMIEHSSESPQSIAFPVTVNGQLNPQGDVDQFQLVLKAGQQIVCAVEARRFGSPSDTTLRLLDSAGRVVAIGNDHRGLDALLAYRCTTDGNFVLQLYNFDLSGRPNHVYRLTLTDGPYVDYAFPPGLQRGLKSTVGLFGWNLSTGNTLAYSAMPNPEESLHQVVIPNSPNRLAIPVGNWPEKIEAEPNDDAASAQAISVPMTVNGRFAKPADADVFRFAAKKGQQVKIDVAAAELGFATDTVLTVSNDKDAVLKTVDDDRGTPDPSLLFTATADGDYTVTLKERAARGRADLIYRITFAEPEPDLQISVKTSEYAMESGAELEIPVTITKQDGFAEEFELTATGLPTGVTVETQQLAAKSPAAVKLKFVAAKNLPFPASTIRIVARSTLNGKPIERIAQAAVTMFPGAKPLHTEQLWLAVRPHIPFTLSLPGQILEAPRMAAFPFPVTAVREEGFADAIRLVGVDRDRRGTVVPMSGMIKQNETGGTIPLIVQKKAIEGTTHRCRVMGVIDVTGPDGKQYPVFHVGKGTMLMGCQPNLLTLAVEPSQVTWRTGETIEVTVTAVRRTTMNDVTVSALVPDDLVGIEIQSMKLSVNQLQSTLKMRIAPDAKLPPRAVVQLRAESSRNGLPIYAAAPLTVVAP